MKDVMVARHFSIHADGTLVHGSGHGQISISINFERPVLKREGSDWWFECVYTIELDGGVMRESYGVGIDGVAALLAAMSLAVGDLENRYFAEWNLSAPREYFDDMRSD